MRQHAVKPLEKNLAIMKKFSHEKKTSKIGE